MRKTLVLFVFLLLISAVKSQDKIITHKGDTILCKIVSVNASHISYEQRTDSKYVIGKSIFVEDVKEYIRLPEEPALNRYEKNKQPRQKPAYPLLLSFSPGGTYLPWSLDYLAIEYPSEYNAIKHGLHLNSSVHYLFNTHVGAGIQYSFFTSGVEVSTPMMVEPMYPIYAIAHNKNRQYINYLGASGILQQFLGGSRKLQLSESLSAGLVMFREESQLTTDFPDSNNEFSTQAFNSLTTGMTFGATLGVSLEYYIQPKLSVGAGGEFMYAQLRRASGEMKSMSENMSFKSLKLSSPINLSRIDYSLIIRLHF